MKRSPAYLAALLAALPATAVAQCLPQEQLNECELALFETATILDGRNKECRVLLKTCEDKMTIRTSTVIREIVKPCPVSEPVLTDWQLVLTSGAAGLILGMLTAFLAR